MFQIDRNIEENAPKLYGKTNEILQKETEKLHGWMQSRNDIFPEIMNHTMIRNFIMINKFNIEKAKDHIANYYRIRVKYPEFYVKSNPKLENIKMQMDITYITALPKRTENMERVVIVKLARLDLASSYNAIDFISYGIALLEIFLQADLMVNMIAIFDQKELPLNIILKTTPGVCYRTVKILEKVFSFRISKIYFINVPTYAYCFLTMLKSVMKAKFHERIQICSDDSIVHRDFPKSMLPSDYGGEEKTLQELTEVQRGIFQEYQKRFDKLDEIQNQIMHFKDKNHHNCALS